MVHSMMKKLKGISVESTECLMRMHKRIKKKYDTFCTSLGKDDHIATSAKLLDITYESYGFSGDIIETIN